MTTKELIKGILEKWRFPVIQETETGVVFRYQMNVVQANCTDGERPAISVIYTGTFTANDDREFQLGLKTCNQLNFHLMLVKAYLDNDNDLNLSAELFYRNEDDLEYLFQTALKAIVSGKMEFIKRYRDVEAEQRLISELNEPDLSE